MIVSINQPAYLPWIGYFDRIYRSDIHVILDHVQFEKNSMLNRNKIRTSNGWSWLTVPIITKSRFGNLEIQNLEIDNSKLWRKKHLNALKMNYSKSNYFSHFFPYFEKIFSLDWIKIDPLLQDNLSYFLNALNINTKIIKSSDLKIFSSKSNLIDDICKKFGASTYLSGPFGRDYLDLKKFDSAKIKVKFADYNHPSYDQVYDGFEPFMSIVDLLFNHGGAGSLDILANSSSTSESDQRATRSIP